MHRFIRWLVLLLIRLYYPRIEVEGREFLPAHGPVLFVLNHPNGLLDPLLLMTELDYPIAFLAKDTFFRNPLGRLFMRAFHAVPVYRRSDAAGGDTRSKNDQTFALCRALLHKNGAMALFPEGTTHSEPALLPLKTGASRIALGAEAETDWALDLTVVPVGLWYEDKQLFRSSVLLIVGQPWSLDSYGELYAQDVEHAVDQVTQDIAHRLGSVVFQATNAELVRGLPLMVQWSIEHLKRPDPHRRTLLAAYTRFAHDHPHEMEQLAHEASRYARTLRMLGITDPWSPQLPLAHRSRFMLMGALLLLSFPLFVLGLLISYLPYRLGGIIATRITDEQQVLGTIKLIAGAILVPLGWLGAGLVAGWLLDWRAGVLMVLLAPLISYVTLRWSELWREMNAAASASWIRLFKRDLSQQLLERRQQLSAQVVTSVLGLNDSDLIR